MSKRYASLCYKSTGRMLESVSWRSSMQIDEHTKLKSGNAEPSFARQNTGEYRGGEGKIPVAKACPEGRCLDYWPMTSPGWVKPRTS